MVVLGAAVDEEDAGGVDEEEDAADGAFGETGVEVVAEFFEEGDNEPQRQRNEHGEEDDAQFELRGAGAAFVFEFGAGEHGSGDRKGFYLTTD